VTLRGYRRERLVLALVTAAALVPVNPLNTADVSRLALTEAVVRDATLHTERFAPHNLDRAAHGGHLYSDKAPGISFAAIPAVVAVAAADRVRAVDDPQPWRRLGHLWLYRLLTGGVAFAASVWLVGRLAEGLAASTGAATAATYGLGTIAGPMGPTTFGSLAAGALGLAGLALLRRPLVAGLLAGAAIVFEYQAGLIALALLALSRRPRFLVGLVPPLAVLAAYDWIAFGAPWRLSYRYVANEFAEQQHEGFFGIGAPTADGVWHVLVSPRGLLLLSPVLALAAAGLWLWRTRVALACAALAVVFVLYDAGYFDPNGGTSPGPRFLAPMLPFLALGLPFAFRRWPLATTLAAAWSIAACTFDALTWAIGNALDFRDGLPQTVWSLAGTSRASGVALVWTAATAAAAVALASHIRHTPDPVAATVTEA
jgi:hypothetical protein